MVRYPIVVAASTNLLTFETLHISTANPKLGTWVHTQRRQYKLMLEGKKSAMNEEKIAALDSLGFTWVAKTNGWSMN